MRGDAWCCVVLRGCVVLHHACGAVEMRGEDERIIMAKIPGGRSRYVDNVKQ